MTETAQDGYDYHREQKREEHRRRHQLVVRTYALLKGDLKKWGDLNDMPPLELEKTHELIACALHSRDKAAALLNRYLDTAVVFAPSDAAMEAAAKQAAALRRKLVAVTKLQRTIRKQKARVESAKRLQRYVRKQKKDTLYQEKLAQAVAEEKHAAEELLLKEAELDGLDEDFNDDFLPAVDIANATYNAAQAVASTPAWFYNQLPSLGGARTGLTDDSFLWTGADDITEEGSEVAVDEEASDVEGSDEFSEEFNDEEKESGRGWDSDEGGGGEVDPFQQMLDDEGYDSEDFTAACEYERARSERERFVKDYVQAVHDGGYHFETEEEEFERLCEEHKAESSDEGGGGEGGGDDESMDDGGGGDGEGGGGGSPQRTTSFNSSAKVNDGGRSYDSGKVVPFNQRTDGEDYRYSRSAYSNFNLVPEAVLGMSPRQGSEATGAAHIEETTELPYGHKGALALYDSDDNQGGTRDDDIEIPGGQNKRRTIGDLKTAKQVKGAIETQSRRKEKAEAEIGTAYATDAGGYTNADDGIEVEDWAEVDPVSGTYGRSWAEYDVCTRLRKMQALCQHLLDTTMLSDTMVRELQALFEGVTKNDLRCVIKLMKEADWKNHVMPDELKRLWDDIADADSIITVLKRKRDALSEAEKQTDRAKRLAKMKQAVKELEAGMSVDEDEDEDEDDDDDEDDDNDDDDGRQSFTTPKGKGKANGKRKTTSKEKKDGKRRR